MKTYMQQWTIKEMACALAVSRSGYYEYCQGTLSPRQVENNRLLESIQHLYAKSRGTYGSPRIFAELQKQGDRCSRPWVARLMQRVGLQAKMVKAFRKTTRIDAKQTPAPNLLAQDFTAKQPNTKWVADISYIATQEGWLYLAVVLDLYSRKVVGLAMRESLHTDLVMTALKQALLRRHPESGLQHHSDRGCQYTSQEFQALLESYHITCSMSAKGYCYDNAVAESFFHTLKTECVYLTRYQTREEAKASIFEYIELFYNKHRAHSTLGYLSSDEFERDYYQQKTFS